MLCDAKCRFCRIFSTSLLPPSHSLAPQCFKITKKKSYYATFRTNQAKCIRFWIFAPIFWFGILLLFFTHCDLARGLMQTWQPIVQWIFIYFNIFFECCPLIILPQMIWKWVKRAHLLLMLRKLTSIEVWVVITTFYRISQGPRH